MRIIWHALGYLLIVVILTFLGFSTWFAIVWGFTPLMAAPLWVLGLAICSGIVLGLCASSRRHI